MKLFQLRQLCKEVTIPIIVDVLNTNSGHGNIIRNKRVIVSCSINSQCRNVFSLIFWVKAAAVSIVYVIMDICSPTRK
jgi:hypothetical protein